MLLTTRWPFATLFVPSAVATFAVRDTLDTCANTDHKLQNHSLRRGAYWRI